MTCSLRRASSVVGCLMLARGCAFAQASARLNGRVTDENGAVPPRRHHHRYANRYQVRHRTLDRHVHPRRVAELQEKK